jgi:hypothetical protein
VGRGRGEFEESLKIEAQTLPNVPFDIRLNPVSYLRLACKLSPYGCKIAVFKTSDFNIAVVVSER